MIISALHSLISLRCLLLPDCQALFVTTTLGHHLLHAPTLHIWLAVSPQWVEESECRFQDLASLFTLRFLDSSINITWEFERNAKFSSPTHTQSIRTS